MLEDKQAGRSSGNVPCSAFPLALGLQSGFISQRSLGASPRLSRQGLGGVGGAVLAWCLYCLLLLGPWDLAEDKSQILLKLAALEPASCSPWLRGRVLCTGGSNRAGVALSGGSMQARWLRLLLQFSGHGGLQALCERRARPCLEPGGAHVCWLSQMWFWAGL